MTNFLYFSDYFKPAINKVRFTFILFGRCLKILFRWRKGIRLLHLEYTKKNQFHNSYLIIHYRFKNALWYNFKNLKKTTEKKSVVFNLKNLGTTNITLIVYGFFQKKIYQINVQPEKTLEAKSFKIIISGIYKETLFTPFFRLDRKHTLINLPKINVTKRKIEINPSPYNQNDFI
jgi:hypothetical protein